MDDIFFNSGELHAKFKQNKTKPGISESRFKTNVAYRITKHITDSVFSIVHTRNAEIFENKWLHLLAVLVGYNNN